MASKSSDDEHGVPTVEDFAMAAEWQSDEHSFRTAILFYAFRFLAQFLDDGVRAGVDLRWQQVWQDWFAEAHRRGLLVGAVGASYDSTREEGLADPALQIQALWTDSLNGVYVDSDDTPCDHCARRGRWLCASCLQASFCTECEEGS